MTFHFLLRFEEISVSLLFVEVDQWLRSVGQAALGLGGGGGGGGGGLGGELANWRNLPPAATLICFPPVRWRTG